MPLHDDRAIFAFLILEGAQAGLSWDTILRKRDCYRTVFDQFDPEAVARYDQRKMDELLADLGIIRNRAKVAAAIQSVRAFLGVRDACGTFDAYIWQFIGGMPRVNAWPLPATIPAQTPEPAAMSKDLRRRGFTIAGPTICYALMQATGMVNDHTTDCFRHAELGG